VDIDRLISDRARGIDASGIRRVFDLGASLDNPINLSIGQPDFPVPGAIRTRAAEAMEQNKNGYSVTQGIAELRHAIARLLAEDVGWTVDLATGGDGTGLMVTSGTSGALVLLGLVLLDPGDEAIVPDPYFVMYPHMVRMAGGRPVLCDTYPDFRMTAERVEPLITERTKFVLVDSPGNPHGVVLSRAECADLLDLCRSRGVVLVSDEIYDMFTYPESRDGEAGSEEGRLRAPSPARLPGAEEHVALVRGFGKTYGVTGWRLGYLAGPRRLVEEVGKLQQYTYVCAPTPLQEGAVEALRTSMDVEIEEYGRRRDLVVETLGKVTEVALPGGAFYAFVKIPDHLGIDADGFIERCLEDQVLVIPGGVFSERSSHFRISYATKPEMLERGVELIAKRLRG